MRAGLLAVTLAEYQPSEALPGIGGQPTDVIVSPDGSTVVAWHNALMRIPDGQPSTGLFCYDIASGTVTARLAGTTVAGATYYPAAAATTIFLIDGSQLAVQLVSTATWTTSGSIDLAGQATGRPVALAVSSDGSTLFLLVRDDRGSAQLVIYGQQDSPASWAPLGTVTVFTSVMQGSVLTLAVAPDGTKAYVTDQQSGSLLAVERDDAGKYAVSGPRWSLGLPVAMALSPDGTRLYVACGSLVQIQTSTFTVRSAAGAAAGLARLAVVPDGSRVLATDPTTTGVHTFDAASLRLVQTISWTTGVQMPNGLAITPDASQIFTANIKTDNLGVMSQVRGAPG